MRVDYYMKVRVEYTVRADDSYRMALRHHFGQCGTLATRKEIRQQAEAAGESEDDDLMQSWGDCDDCQTAYNERER